VAQVVEYLPGKCEVLNSNPSSTIKKKKKKERKKKRRNVSGTGLQEEFGTVWRHGLEKA
jgi:hypothetical protein